MPEQRVQPVGEDELTGAVEEAITEWLGQARVTAAVAWPATGAWRGLVERIVAPVSRRFYLAAAATAPDDDTVARFVGGMVDRLAASTVPADVRAAHAQHGDAVLSPDWAGSDGDALPWRSRAALIGSHEAQVTAMQAAADTAPGGTRKRWRSRGDDRTRRSHRAASGQTVPIDTPFRIGSASLQYPGDPSGPADEVLRCRCDMYLITQEDSVTAATQPKVTAAVTADLEAPWAPRDTPWEPDEALSRLQEWATDDGELEEDQLARAYLWRTDGPPADWLLPVADIVDGQLVLVWDAVAAAADLVQGGELGLADEEAAQLREVLDSLYVRAAAEWGDEEIISPWQREEAVAAALRAAIIAAPETSEHLMKALAAARDDALRIAESARRRSLAASALGQAIEAAPEWRPPAEWFQPPAGEDGPLVSPEGRVSGYVAPWLDVDGRPMVHAGYAPNGEAIHVPKGGSYGYFHAGNVILTLDDGSQLHPGALTTDIGHGTADGDLADQVAHYDNPLATAAAVIVGEDDTGIWMAGAVLPEVLRDADRMTRLRLMPVSGHWSETQLGAPMELVAVTAVPRPGFPQRSKSGSWELAASLAAAAGGAGSVDVLRELAEQMGAAAETLRRIIATAVSSADAPPAPESDNGGGEPARTEPAEQDGPPLPDGVPAELAAAAREALADGSVTAAHVLPGVDLPRPLQVLADWLTEAGTSSPQARSAAVRAAESICRSDAVEHVGVRMMACRLLSEYKARKKGN
ncbi:hypothetical protein [Streptomyces sp. NBRC 109706]|uniref:hypothetical protein n=1 Tax=Streptomyces sp. NBRC 109706 TaxID=1550035 RepID=UPI000785924D|nr:hypothetical protein [Streptomyces sp. NBRC 109706]